MPFKSLAQARKFRVMEARGEIPKGTSHRWAEHTPNMKKLPEHVDDKAKKAFVCAFLLKCAAAGVTDPKAVAEAAERYAAGLTKAALVGDIVKGTGSAVGGLGGLGLIGAGLGSVVLPGVVGAGVGTMAASTRNRMDEDDADALRLAAEANAYRRRAAEAKLHAQVRQLVASDPSKYVVIG